MLPPDYTFTSGDAGVHTFTLGATLVTAPLQTITATDKSNSSIKGSATVSVTPAAAASFTVSAPSPVSAGVGFQFTVTALDAYGNIATGYTGTPTFSTAPFNATATLPGGTYSFTSGDAGVHTFSATLRTAGTQTLTATDTANTGVTGNAVVSVNPGALASLIVTTTSTTVTAGTSANFTVTAEDSFSNIITGFTGTVHFTTTDAFATPPANYTFTGGDAGIHVFSMTLKQAGSQTLTATDGSVSGTSSAISVLAGALSKFTVTGSPATITAGTSTNFTVTATDSFGNLAAGYTGTVSFSISNNAGTPPAASTLSGGTGVFSGVVLTKSGQQTLTAADSTLGISGTSNPITVNGAAAASLVVTASSTATAGTPFSISLKALDFFGNIANGDNDTVALTSNDPLVASLGTATLASGQGTFPSATLETAQTTTLTATDSGAGISGNATVTVSPGLTFMFIVAGSPTNVTAGTAVSFTVTAEDSFGNLTPAYTGTVGFTSTDTIATPPGNYTFQGGDAGIHTFSVTLKQAGSQTLTATDTVTSAIKGISNAISVSPGATTKFGVVVTPPLSQNNPINFTVTAEDSFGNTTPAYSGTVHFSPTGAGITLPSDYTFSPASDNGVHSFTATFASTGAQTIVATDTTAAPSITGSTTFTVTSGTPTHFAVTANLSTVTAGLPVLFTVQAVDVNGNPTSGYTGTVDLATTDPLVTPGNGLPVSYTFLPSENGVHTFSVILKTAGPETLTATDTLTPSTFNGTSAAVTVTAAAATKFTIVAPSTATAGQSFNFSVTAFDTFGNLAKTYAGTLSFTTSDPQVPTVPGGTLTNGANTFSATLKTAATETITGTDGSITAISGPITVSPGQTTHFAITGTAATVTAGGSTGFTITAEDSFGNTTPAYAGTVSFSISNSAGTPPASTTLTPSGFKVITGVVLTKAGTQFITATDGTNTGTSSPITVNPAGVSSFVLTGIPSTVTAGTATTFTVTADDTYGNIATGYSGTVNITTSDAQAPHVTSNTLASGVGQFTVTLKTAFVQVVTAADSLLPTIKGSAVTTVVAAQAATFTVSAPTSATGNVPFSITVTAKDSYGNLATGYSGTLAFSSTDGSATLPPSNSTLHNGSGTFSVTLQSPNLQTITATDSTSVPNVTGLAVVNVTSTTFSVTAPASTVAGVPLTFTVTALGAGNTPLGSSYTGTVHFTSSDAQASFPSNNVTLTNGTGTFTAILGTAGTQTITATDRSFASETGSTTVSVSASSMVGSFSVVAPSAVTAGQAFNFTVTALDAYGNNATGYSGTVSFTTTDPLATPPTNMTLTNGTGTISAILKTESGPWTIKATDVTSGKSGVSNPITVNGATATHYTVTGSPATVVAGSSANFTVTALDQFGNIANTYSGTTTFATTDPQDTAGNGLPANYTFVPADAGVHTFSVTLKTAGGQTLTATDTSNSSFTATSNVIVVTAGAAAKFIVSAPVVVAGNVPFNFTVSAQDLFHNATTNYTGTVHFTTTDPSGIMPSNSTLVNGIGTFAATLVTSPSQTITATDTMTPSITGTSQTINLTTDIFSISAQATATAGSPFTYTVTALNAATRQVDPNFNGTVHFSSSDPHATLPADYTFVPAVDNGTHLFSGTLEESGTQSLIVSSSAAVTGTTNIQVNPTAATHFGIIAGGSAVAGTPFVFIVDALDQFNNVVSGYNGIVHITSSDSLASVSANSVLSGGQGTFSATFKTAGTQTVTATDTVFSGINGTSGPISVAAGAVTHFVVAAPANEVAGNAILAVVTAEDQFGNIVGNYTGPVHFISTDPQVTAGNGLPGNPDPTLFNNQLDTFNGVGFFAVLLRTAGVQTFTVSDEVNPVITGHATVTVSPAVASTFTISAPPNAVIGSPVLFTVVSQDLFGNTVTGYSGSVHFSSSDAAAILPINSTLTNGVGVFSATFSTPVLGTAGIPGKQTITATDTNNSAITGSSSGTSVHGLYVYSFLPTPTGFVAAFSEPFNPSGINLYGASTATYGPPDVTLVGPGGIVVKGSLLIDPTDTTITFIKTSDFNGINFNPATGVLAPGNYTITFRSASNGFVDLNGNLLDGANDGLNATATNGVAGVNYSAFFSVGATPVVVGVPAFARGPAGTQTINLPNSQTGGIPINLSNGGGVTSGKFTIQYNPALLSISGVEVNPALAGASLSLDAASTLEPQSLTSAARRRWPRAWNAWAAWLRWCPIRRRRCTKPRRLCTLPALSSTAALSPWKAMTPCKWWPTSATFRPTCNTRPSTPRSFRGWRPVWTRASRPFGCSIPSSSATSTMPAP